MSFQEILKIHDGNPLEVARILFFKIRPSQEILKIRDGTPSESEEMSSQEIQKNHDGNPLKSEEILTYIKSPQNRSVWHFSTKLDVPNNVVHKKEWHGFCVSKLGHLKKFQKFVMVPFGVGRNFDIHKKPPKRNDRPSQEIPKIRDGTPLELEEILTYIKSPQNGTLDVPSNELQKKRVAWILFFKIMPSQEILKIRDGTSLEAEEILTYIKKSSRNGSVCHFLNKLDDPKIQKIHDGTPLESEEILTYIKSPKNRSVWHFSNKLDDPSNIVQNKRVARILFFKIRPSQEILKIHDGNPLESEEILTYIKKPPKQIVACIMFFKIRPSQEILKIRDGTPLESEEILAYIKSPQNGSVWHFYSKSDVPSNVIQKKRVAWILFFKIRPSQEILKIRDGTPSESEEILTYIKKPPKQIVARILFFKIRPSQEILKIRDGTPSESEEMSSQEIQKNHDGNPLKSEDILTYIKSPQNRSVWHFSTKPSQEIPKIRDGTPLELEEILTYIKSPQNGTVWPSQKILKIRDGTPLESKEILTYIKSPQNRSVWHFSTKLDVPNNVVHKKRVAWILCFKIRPSQEIPKIRDGTPLELEEILTYIKSPQNGTVWHFSSKLYIHSNVVQNKRVAWIRFFKIRPSQKILKIRDGTPLESEEILTYIKAPKMDRVAWILFFKIMPSQEILKIRDGTSLEAEEILTYIKKALETDRPSQEILKIRDGTPSESEEMSSQEIQKNHDDRPSQEIPKIRDGTPLELEEILTYIKSPQNGTVWHFSSKLYIHSNVVQNKRVAWILFFKIRPSQKILKIRDGTPLESKEILTYIKSPQNRSVWHFSTKLDVPNNVVHKKRVAWILCFKIRPSQEIPKIRDGTPLELEEILTYIKSPQNGTVWHFSSKLYIHSNVVQNKRVAWIRFFKIRPSQKILKIRDGTPLESEEILTYIKAPKMDRYVAWILFFKIMPSQEILKIRDGTSLEAEEILTYIKKALETDRPSQEILKIRDGTPLDNVVQKKRVAWILFFKISPSQEILKIHDGTPSESVEILTYIKKPPKQIGMALFYQVR
ncbi:hypothetical protein OROMI_015120 [Orobanche minor]